MKTIQRDKAYKVSCYGFSKTMEFSAGTFEAEIDDRLNQLKTEILWAMFSDELKVEEICDV